VPRPAAAKSSVMRRQTPRTPRVSAPPEAGKDQLRIAQISADVRSQATLASTAPYMLCCLCEASWVTIVR
jgi:hypothetical protein